MLTLTSTHISSSPGVESNQSNVTCFDLIRSAHTGEATRSERKLSDLVPALIGWTRDSHQLTDNSSLVAQLKISEASEKYM